MRIRLHAAVDASGRPIPRATPPRFRATSLLPHDPHQPMSRAERRFVSTGYGKPNLRGHIFFC